MVRKLSAVALLVTAIGVATRAQNAGVIAAASRAMGVDRLTSITYSGTARNGAFGQSKLIAKPMGPVNLTQITQYTRTVIFDQAPNAVALVSRATGPTQPPTVPGAPPRVRQSFVGDATSRVSGEWPKRSKRAWSASIRG